MNTLEASLDRLYSRRTFGIKLGLDVEQRLLALLGNPEKSFPCVHVAGTNGKGSVCALLASTLQAAGYRVGLYTSPHLVRFNERIQVNGSLISDEDLSDLIGAVDPHSSTVAAETSSEPTFFEYSTALAFEHFRRQKVEIAVLETGMGGRLDATNVVTPVVSVITRISLEHTEHLGKTLEAVAAEKGGIIKQGRPVVCGATASEALGVLRKISAERNAPFVYAPDLVTVELRSSSLDGHKVRVETAEQSYGTLTLPLPGGYQLENLATAIAAVETLRNTTDFVAAAKDVKSGTASVSWPGRFHVLQREPPLIADGGHNPGAMSVLAESLRRLFKGRPIGLIFGMCADKDLRGSLAALRNIVDRLWGVPLASERGRPVEEIVATACSLGMNASAASLSGALSEAGRWAGERNGAICVTGSLFLVGELLALEKGS